MEKNGFVSHVHRKKPQGRAMLETIRRANNAKSKSARMSSTSSPSRRIGWRASSEPSGLPERE
jgi:hypothetical protein